MSIRVYHLRPVPGHGEFREFSPEVHGDSYLDIAKEYAETNKSNVREVVGDEAESPIANEEDKISATPTKGRAKKSVK